MNKRDKYCQEFKTVTYQNYKCDYIFVKICTILVQPLHQEEKTTSKFGMKIQILT